MNVGIFGFYSWLNFGDDLMAVLFAEEISRLGHKPILYLGDLSSIPQAFSSYETASNLDDFVNSVDKVVVGGGGILKPENGRSGEIFYCFRNTCLGLTKRAEKTGTQLGAFSIGGDGCGGNIGLHIGIASLITSSRMEVTTLRLAADRPIFTHLDNHVEVHPDVVFASAKKMGFGPKAPGIIESRLRVGLNLYDRKPDRVLRRALAALPIISKVEISTGGTTPLGSKECVSYDGDITRFVEQLKSLDVIITCKLHLGVVAIALGIPTFLFYGPAKARCCYREAGLDVKIIDSAPKMLSLLLKLISAKRASTADLGGQSDIQHLIDGATNHLKLMSTWIGND